MKNKTAILFDLDGTIVDASECIIRIARESMMKFGVEPDPDDDMKHVMGPPLIDTFKGHYHFDDELSEKMTQYYRERYGKVGITEFEIYPGMAELIKDIKAQGKKVLMATSKPGVYAKQMMEHAGLAEYFDGIAGPALLGNHTKADMIREALKMGDVTDLSTAVQVGDRHYDVTGALEVGIDCIGVLYGFGEREELESAGAAATAETVDDLRKLLGA